MVCVKRHRRLCVHLWHRQAVECDMKERVTSLGLHVSGGPTVAIFPNVSIYLAALFQAPGS